MKYAKILLIAFAACSSSPFQISRCATAQTLFLQEVMRVVPAFLVKMKGTG